MTAVVPGRAAPMSPGGRRSAIVEAALPLLREHGAAVTTRQIADAAGIAEGTIFRVFPTKQALIDAAVTTALNPATTLAALSLLDDNLPLAERLRRTVTIVHDRFTQVIGLMIALRMPRPHDHDGGPGAGNHHAGPQPHDDIIPVIARGLARHADELRCSPAHAARLLRLLAFAGSHPRINDETPLTVDEIVDMLMNGITTGHAADLPPPAALRG